MSKTLLDKVWEAHAVRELPNGATQLLIGTHLIHEVTSPQAFGMLRDLGVRVLYPDRTFATVDHIVPTDEREEPFSDQLADEMIKALRKNCEEYGITFFDLPSGKQGIVHIVGPELGITQPGTTIACGDSHTSTHGAFGAIAFGIGTRQVRDVLASVVDRDSLVEFKPEYGQTVVCATARIGLPLTVMFMSVGGDARS